MNILYIQNYLFMWFIKRSLLYRERCSILPKYLAIKEDIQKNGICK